jgi:hypothetical protein
MRAQSREDERIGRAVSFRGGEGDKGGGGEEGPRMDWMLEKEMESREGHLVKDRWDEGTRGEGGKRLTERSAEIKKGWRSTKNTGNRIRRTLERSKKENVQKWLPVTKKITLNLVQ